MFLRMIHTARRRKREERRKKIGLNSKINLNEEPPGKPKDKDSKFNQDEKLDLEASTYSNIFGSTLLAIDKNFSGSMATIGWI